MAAVLSLADLKKACESCQAQAASGARSALALPRACQHRQQLLGVLQVQLSLAENWSQLMRLADLHDNQIQITCDLKALLDV